MRLRLLALAAVCAIAPAGLASQVPQGRILTLEARIESALGARPADCGLHEITPSEPATAGDLTKSVACVLEHAARKTSAWTTIRGGGIDSDIASGLMVGADGVNRYFDYDSVHLTSWDARSPLSEQPCRKAAVVERAVRGAYFVCEG